MNANSTPSIVAVPSPYSAPAIPNDVVVSSTPSTTGATDSCEVESFEDSCEVCSLVVVESLPEFDLFYVDNIRVVSVKDFSTFTTSATIIIFAKNSH